MKKFNYFTAAAIFLFAFTLFTVSCDKDDSNEDNPNNQLPTCLIASPADGTEFNQGAEVNISVNALDEDGTIEQVRFYVDNAEVGSISQSPWTFTINTDEYSAGDHTLKATAYDNDNGTGSDEVTITINEVGACGGVSEIAYGGKVYNTVEIGTQCWLKENLNYESGNSWCYENDPSNCETYGRLYDWSTAVSVCPDGWHLPTDDEWKTLLGFVDSEYGVGDPVWDGESWIGSDAGKKLKSTSGWADSGNGTDDFGFAAMPGGYYDNYFETFYDQEFYGTWWSSSEAEFERWGYELSYEKDRPYRGSDYIDCGRSVRCIKD